MNTKEYNGWTNYETWLVKLWLDNEEVSQRYWEGQTKIIWRYAKPKKPFTKSENAKLLLANTLNIYYENACLDVLEAGTNSTATFFHDLMNSALSEVNWHEIADSLLAGHVAEYNQESNPQPEPVQHRHD